MGRYTERLYQLSREFANRSKSPEWQAHYQHAQDFIRQGMWLADGRERLTVLGHGLGLDIPQAAYDFPEIILNDIDAVTLYQGIKRHQHNNYSGHIRPVQADLAGAGEFLERVGHSLSDTGHWQHIARHLVSFRSASQDLTGLFPPADVVISSMLLTQLWAQPYAVLREILDQYTSLGRPQQQIKQQIATTLQLETGIKHLQLLKQITNPSGVIILITDTVGFIDHQEIPLIHPRTGSELRQIALITQSTSPIPTIRSWTWQYDSQDTRQVTGFYLSPLHIPEYRDPLKPE